LAKYPIAPLVAMAKSPDPSKGFEAAFKVQVKPFGPLKGQPATALIAATLQMAQKAFRDCEIVQPPTEIEVSGLPSSKRVDVTT
jgi:hypothetical protein